MSALARVVAAMAVLPAALAAVPAAAVLPAGTPSPVGEPPRFDALVVGGGELATTGAAVVTGHPDADPLPEEAENAAAWLVADASTGAVLAAQDAYVPLPPASTIKLLTALALFPLVPPDIAYTATEADARTEGSRVGLVPDEIYSRADLEHGLIVASGNDAAHALAGLAGGLDAAVELMNAEARRLGAFTTVARTPHGLDEPGQVSSAYDLALIGLAALADDGLAALAATRTYEFPGLDDTSFQIQNHNRLLGGYPGILGLKSGYTSEAGHTIVAAAEREGTRFIVTVLGADGRAEPVAAALLDWAFDVPADAQPVGRLVTPDEAAAAVEAVQHGAASDSVEPAHAGGGSPDSTDGPAPGQHDDLDDPHAQSPATANHRWVAVWAGLGAAALVVASMIVVRRRRRRPAGRYAA